jgi:hypothetical protein
MSRTEENTTKVRQIVSESHWLIVRSLAEQLNIDRQTVRKILTEDLDMRKVYAINGPKGALSVREFLASKQVTVLEHPLCSPDLACIEFFLFPKIKEILIGRHFDDIDDIRSNDSNSEGHSTKPVPNLF